LFVVLFCFVWCGGAFINRGKRTNWTADAACRNCGGFDECVDQVCQSLTSQASSTASMNGRPSNCVMSGAAAAGAEAAAAAAVGCGGGGDGAATGGRAAIVAAAATGSASPKSPKPSSSSSSPASAAASGCWEDAVNAASGGAAAAGASAAAVGGLDGPAANAGGLVAVPAPVDGAADSKSSKSSSLGMFLAAIGDQTPEFDLRATLGVVVRLCTALYLTIYVGSRGHPRLRGAAGAERAAAAQQLLPTSAVPPSTVLYSTAFSADLKSRGPNPSILGSNFVGLQEDFAYIR